MKIREVEAFQVQWAPEDKPAQRSAWVRVRCDDGSFGIGEASPMRGGLASLGIVKHDLAPALIGEDPLDHAVLQDRLLHSFMKLGPEGALTGALAAIDIALWDLKGKLLGQPVYKLLGGAWRTRLPFYASIGGNGERSIDEVLRVVESRLKGNPAAVKIRFDNDRTKPDLDIPGDIAKARAVRRLVGDGLPLAFDANNGYSVGGAIRVGRALEELGYWWFEELSREGDGRGRAEARYHGLGRRTDLHVLWAHRSDHFRCAHGVQPDIVKMGGITGLMRCAALAHGHGVELVPHQTQPTIGHVANLHLAASQLHFTKPCELNDPSPRQHAAFENPPRPVDGLFHLPSDPGLGLRLNEAELGKRRVPVS